MSRLRTTPTNCAGPGHVLIGADFSAIDSDQFETVIEERILNPRYSWPLIPISRHRCTMAAALANALPVLLAAAPRLF